jgi:hypothetical protein
MVVYVETHLLDQRRYLLIGWRIVSSTFDDYWPIPKIPSASINLIHSESLKFLQQFRGKALIWSSIRARVDHKLCLDDSIAAFQLEFVGAVLVGRSLRDEWAHVRTEARSSRGQYPPW